MRALIVLNEHKQSASGVVSLQVLQEYFVTVTRKYGIGAADARRKVELFAAFDVVEPVLGDVLAAIDLHRLHNVSYWDALVIHSARSAGCDDVARLQASVLRRHATRPGHRWCQDRESVPVAIQPILVRYDSRALDRRIVNRASGIFWVHHYLSHRPSHSQAFESQGVDGACRLHLRCKADLRVAPLGDQIW